MGGDEIQVTLREEVLFLARRQLHRWRPAEVRMSPLSCTIAHASMKFFIRCPEFSPNVVFEGGQVPRVCFVPLK